MFRKKELQFKLKAITNSYDNECKRNSILRAENKKLQDLINKSITYQFLNNAYQVSINDIKSGQELYVLNECLSFCKHIILEKDNEFGLFTRVDDTYTSGCYGYSESIHGYYDISGWMSKEKLFEKCINDGYIKMTKYILGMKE